MSTRRRVAFPLVVLSVGLVGGLVARALAQTPTPKPPTPPPPTNCKTHGPYKCCDPAIAAHLTKEAVFSACGESEATYLGEEGSKDACKYVFKEPGAKEEESFVQVYAPPTKDVPTAPNDPFFSWGHVGKVFFTDRALSPKSAPMLAGATGLWLAGKGYIVSVNASTKVCTKAEAKRLAPHMK